MKTVKMLLPPPPKPQNIELVKVYAGHTRAGEVDMLDIATAENRYEHINDIFNNLLPVEQDSGAAIVAERNKLHDELGKLNIQKRIHEYSEGKYLLLDLAPLKWRNQQFLPTFGVFSLNSPITGFYGHAKRDWRATEEKYWMHPAVPRLIESCFGDVVELAKGRVRNQFSKLSSMGQHEMDIKLETRFTGLIPDDVKHDVAEACAPRLFRAIYMIAEVEQWDWQQVVQSRKGDPLIVGYDGYQLWLIRAFDTTDAEQLMADKFAYKPW
ncbi:MAG: hypothetical protein WCO48_00725 [Candidatus Taylorbacteria bacterium]